MEAIIASNSRPLGGILVLHCWAVIALVAIVDQPESDDNSGESRDGHILLFVLVSFSVSSKGMKNRHRPVGFIGIVVY
jgi:hypothetical protein